MTYKDELKKGERHDTSQQADTTSKTTPDKAKMLKKAVGDRSPQATVAAVKTTLKEA